MAYFDNAADWSGQDTAVEPVDNPPPAAPPAEGDAQAIQQQIGDQRTQLKTAQQQQRMSAGQFASQGLYPDVPRGTVPQQPQPSPQPPTAAEPSAAPIIPGLVTPPQQPSAAIPGLLPPKPSPSVQPEGILGSLLRPIASGIVPAAGTAAGGILGAGLGAVAGIPEGPVAIATAIAGDVAGGAAGGALAEKAQRAVMGGEWTDENRAQMEANAKEHPIASSIGTFVPAIISMLGGGGGKTLENATAGFLKNTAEKAVDHPGYVAKALAALPSNMVIGARMGAGAAAAQAAGTNNDYSDVLQQSVKGAVTMGPVAFVPAAGSMLGEILGKAPADAAVLAMSNALYEKGVHGKEIDGSQLAKDIGTDLPGFMLLNLIGGLTHGKPWIPPEKPITAAPIEPTSKVAPVPTMPTPEPGSPVGADASTVDGLNVALRVAEEKGATGQADEIRAQLANIKPEDISAAEETKESPTESTPQEAPTEAPEIPGLNPPVKSGTSDLFKQAREERGPEYENDANSPYQKDRFQRISDIQHDRNYLDTSTGELLTREEVNKNYQADKAKSKTTAAPTISTAQAEQADGLDPDQVKVATKNLPQALGKAVRDVLLNDKSTEDAAADHGVTVRAAQEASEKARTYLGDLSKKNVAIPKDEGSLATNEPAPKGRLDEIDQLKKQDEGEEPMLADSGSKEQNLLAAYKKLHKNTGFPDVHIADVMDAAGITDLKEGHALLDKLHKAGEINFGTADWSLASENKRKWARPTSDERFKNLTIRYEHTYDSPKNETVEPAEVRGATAATGAHEGQTDPELERSIRAIFDEHQAVAEHAPDSKSTFQFDPKTGKIGYNLSKISERRQEIEKASPGAGDEWMRMAAQEEVAHQIDAEQSRDALPNAGRSIQRLVWDAAPKAVKDLFPKVYQTKVSDHAAGAELIRMIFQGLKFGKITESFLPDRDVNPFIEALNKWNPPSWLKEHIFNMLKAAGIQGGSSEGEVLHADFGQLFRDLHDKAVDTMEAVKDERKSGPLRESIAAQHDSINTRANYHGVQVKTKMRLEIPEAKDREAMPFVVEAGGDNAKLQQFKSDIAASVDPKLAKKYDPIIDHAIAEFDRLDKLKGVHEKLMEDSFQESNANGIDVGREDNYVRRMFNPPDSVQGVLPNPIFSMGSGQGKSAKGFTKGRVFESLAEGIKAGWKPVTTDIASLDGERIESAKTLLFRKQLLDKLKNTPAPTDGKPVIGKMVTRQLANGETEQAVPRGYAVVNAGGQPLVVHDDLAGLFKDLYGDSVLRRNAVGRAILKTAAGIKSAVLGLDTFHVGRVLFKMATAGGGAPFEMENGKPKFNIGKGRALLEYDDSDLSRAVASGEISQQDAAWARTNRPKAEKLMASGMNIGRVSDNLLEQAKLHLPIISGLNDWIFNKLSRAAMLQSALPNLERNLKNPKYTEEQAYRQTAKEMNELFGNLQNQGIFKSKTMQDISRVIFLAPNWTESQFRNEARSYGQVGTSAVDALRGRGLRVGNSTRAFAAGFVAMLAANQVANYLSRGQSTFQNEEDDHKLDAWIPGGKRGFWFNPFEIAGEYAHAAFKYLAQHENPVDVATHIASNKLSPLARGTKEALTGRDFSGRRFLNNTDRFRSAATDALPIPLISGAGLEKDPRQPLGFRSTRAPGSLEKQLLQSVGAKVTAAQSPRQQMFALAAPFRGDKMPVETVGEYTELRRALENDDDKGVKSEVKWLTEERGKTLDKIALRLGISPSGAVKPEPFAGPKDVEEEFVKSLTPPQQKLYAQAQKDHMDEANHFIELTGWHPNGAPAHHKSAFARA